MPVLEGVDAWSPLEDGLREVAGVEADVAQDRLLEVLAGAKAVRLQDVLDPAVEALDHAVGLAARDGARCRDRRSGGRRRGCRSRR